MAHETLDLSGVPCPANSARALMKIESMADGSLLEILVDDGEPVENLSASLESEGHSIVSRTREGGKWKITARRA